MIKRNGIIGNTPMIKINYKYNDNIRYIYTKLEYFNISRQYKG